MFSRKRIEILFLFLVYSLEAQQVKASPPIAKALLKEEKTKPTQEELLTTDASEAWHRRFVKSWNEWVNTQEKTPDFASKETLLQKLGKDVFASKRERVNAQTSSAIVSFLAKTETIEKKQQSPHRLTIRLLTWPKFLVNGNAFLFDEKKSLDQNYNELKKSHHYKALLEKETKKEFSLAALSYMTAIKEASAQVKAESKMRMQKPNASQIAGAGKGPTTNIPGIKNDEHRSAP
jgi:hypothetical protein